MFDILNLLTIRHSLATTQKLLFVRTALTSCSFNCIWTVFSARNELKFDVTQMNFSPGIKILGHAAPDLVISWPSPSRIQTYEYVTNSILQDVLNVSGSVAVLKETFC